MCAWPPADLEEVAAVRRSRGRIRRLRRMRPALMATSGILGVVLSLACLASLLPSALSVVAPDLSRRLLVSPQRVWDSLIDRYNRGYNLETSAHFSATLSTPFAPQADLAVLSEWAAMRRRDGEIVSYTLTLDPGSHAQPEVDGSVFGSARIRLRSGLERCYRVAFLNTETGYLILRIQPQPCPQAEGP